MICVSYTGTDFPTCMQLLKEEDFAEIRIDTMDLTQGQVKALFSLPIKTLATCRPCDRYTDGQRLSLLKEAIHAGAAYVDIEIEAEDDYREELLAYAKSHKTPVIISYHHFSATPALVTLQSITQQCFSLGADLAKIVTTIHTQKDLANTMALYAHFDNIIAFGMGEKGKTTRVLATHFGAPYTYAAPDNGILAAPGQIPKHIMKKQISLLQDINKG